MHDLLDETSDVAVTLGKVQRTELGGRHAVVRVRSEDASALTLVADDWARQLELSRAGATNLDPSERIAGGREPSAIVPARTWILPPNALLHHPRQPLPYTARPMASLPELSSLDLPNSPSTSFSEDWPPSPSSVPTTRTASER